MRGELRYVQDYDFLFPSSRQIKETVDWYIPHIKAKLKEDYTYATAIVGDRRVGKSSLACEIARRLDPGFNHTRVMYSIRELFRCIKDLPPESVIQFDEAGVSHDSHYWRKWESELFKQLAEIWGFKKIVCVY